MEENQLNGDIEFFKHLTNNSFDIISLLSDKGIIIYENLATKRTLGYDSGKRNGKSVFEFVHPDDREKVQYEFSIAIKNKEKIKNLEFRYKHEDGSWVWLEAIGQNFNDDPKINAIHGILLRIIKKVKK